MAITKINTYKVDVSIAANPDGTFTITASIAGPWGHRHSISATAASGAEAWAAASAFGAKLERWVTREYPDAD